MLLTVDVGNTHTVIGGYEYGEEVERAASNAGASSASDAGASNANNANSASNTCTTGSASSENNAASSPSLRFIWRMATNKKQTEDEIRATLSSMFFAQHLDCSCVSGVALASVVPQLSMAWKRVSRDLFGVEAFVCSAETTKGLFKADYPNMHEIGADRIADAIACVHLYGAPAVVVDFGTATNIEVVNKDGLFVGGIIAPGVVTSASALFSFAAKLAATELVDPGTVIGKSTETAIQSGIVYGEAGRVDSLIRRIFAELGYTAPVIATGGQAPIIASCSETITHLNAELTLEGLRLAYEFNARK